MSCKKFRSEIEEAARGSALGAGAAAHVASCASCRAFSEESARLDALVSSLARVEAPDDFEFRLRARIARAGGEKRTWRRAFVPDAAWLAVAACLVLALGAFVHFRAGAKREQTVGAQGATVAQAGSQDEARANDVRTAVVTSPGANDQPTTVQVPMDSQPKGASFVPVRKSSATQREPRRERFVLPRRAVEQIAVTLPVQPRIESRTSDFKGGTRIYTATPIPVPLASPDRKLEALFNDARGAKRVVAVDPFAFGARGQTKDTNVKNASYTGVW